jgi:hypothetical protein
VDEDEGLGQDPGAHQRAGAGHELGPLERDRPEGQHEPLGVLAKLQLPPPGLVERPLAVIVRNADVDDPEAQRGRVRAIAGEEGRLSGLGGRRPVGRVEDGYLEVAGVRHGARDPRPRGRPAPPHRLGPRAVRQEQAVERGGIGLEDLEQRVARPLPGRRRGGLQRAEANQERGFARGPFGAHEGGQVGQDLRERRDEQVSVEHAVSLPGREPAMAARPPSSTTAGGQIEIARLLSAR